MELGASFSHIYLQSLGITPLNVLKDYVSLGFSWIRLGCYWDKIERIPGKYTFHPLDLLIEHCEKHDLKILLTIGMKAPRWPEFYIPDWIQDKTDFDHNDEIDTYNTVLFERAQQYISACVKHFKSNSAIRVWQLENEPFDPSGPKNLTLSEQFLEKEVSLVRYLDPSRKILINLWGNELSKRQIYKKVITIADIIGLDLYPRVPLKLINMNTPFYVGPRDRADKIQTIVKEMQDHGKEVWISELQAEPWEHDGNIFNSKRVSSFLSKHFYLNYEYGISFQPAVLFFWGFEYWYFCMLRGDSSFWKNIRHIISHR